ncbi:MAG TPA: nucleoside 2-deoxyribosyltransferase [Candidatus Paceibacterota bacterium]|nr:nucleoside 2-deoxyribosyltransferase [Candidatus Paceibacterota bacterium]
MLKIYFAASIRGGRDDQEIYFELIERIGKYAIVLTEHFGSAELTGSGEALLDREIYERDMSWLRSADAIISEVTQPSLGVGYELGQAEALNKPVLCLYRSAEGKRVSAMLAGNSTFSTNCYSSVGEAEEMIKLF